MHHLICSNLINVDILVIAAIVPVFVELDIVIHTLMAIPRTRTVSMFSPESRRLAHTYQSR